MADLVMTAIVPLLFLMGLGAVLRYTKLLPEAYWEETAWLCENLLLPAVVFKALLGSALLNTLPLLLGLALGGAVLAVALILLSLKVISGTAGGGWGALVQASLRFNFAIGLGFVASFFGEAALAQAALCVVIVLPLVNLLCMLLAALGGGLRLSFVTLIHDVLFHPIVLAGAAAYALGHFGVALPKGVVPMIGLLGDLAMPLGVLAAGASLGFGSSAIWGRPVLFSLVLKFGVLPAITLFLAQTVGLSRGMTSVAVLIMLLPAIASSHAYARYANGDHAMMQGLVSVQVLLSIVVVPAVMMALGRI